MKHDLKWFLSSRVARARMHLKLSQEEFAKLTHFSVSFISMLERGERSISIDGLQQLAELTGFPAEWFIDGYEEQMYEPPG